MLKLTIPKNEFWDEVKGEFVYQNERTIQLEHSLVSLSKWEAKWHKPFLSKDPKTSEEIRDYIRFMTVTQNVDPELYEHLTADQYKQINQYIDDPMTATWFRKEPRRSSSEQVTAELIYYWMIALNIPFECQKWHLNRLLTLIKVCNIKQQPDKKMSKKEILANNAALNAARRARLKTRG